MSNDTWLQIRVTKKFKEILQNLTGKRGMSKYVVKAVEEKMERERE